MFFTQLFTHEVTGHSVVRNNAYLWIHIAREHCPRPPVQIVQVTLMVMFPESIDKGRCKGRCHLQVLVSVDEPWGFRVEPDGVSNRVTVLARNKEQPQTHSVLPLVDLETVRPKMEEFE